VIYSPLAVFIHDILIWLYKAGISIAALWNKKARAWKQGRWMLHHIFQDVPLRFEHPVVWMHCSSLGEFEQGRPILDHLRNTNPHRIIIISFFSPSGYEPGQYYKGAKNVFYLPLDGRKKAKAFIDMIEPDLVLWVKYDYWFHYLDELRQRNIPTLLVSAIFRKKQPFFKWYGGLHRKMLSCFTHLFVQDENSKKLLAGLGHSNVTVSGDTRFDRVRQIVHKFEPIDIIEKFCGNDPVLVAGSTWPADEALIKKATADKKLKLIIVPHEIGEEHIKSIKKLLPDSILFSEVTVNLQPSTAKVLIVDTIGLLSRIYKYATITYVGGGFDAGIHNTLEAAAYGKPVLFGPKHEKFREAKGLIEWGGGISVSNTAECARVIEKLLHDKDYYVKTCKASEEYVTGNMGATAKILNYIQANRLLTS
jgi:3-deoxy-D-manno-octulosonic-acid transferase